MPTNEPTCWNCKKASQCRGEICTGWKPNDNVFVHHSGDEFSQLPVSRMPFRPVMSNPAQCRHS